MASVETPVSIRTAVATDFRTAHWGRRVALVAVAGWLAYEWGPGNETVTPWLLARVIARTDSAAVIPLTALVGFVFTLAQQTASGFTALTGFSMFDRTARAAWTRLSGRSETPPRDWSTLGWPTRAATVFALGTTAIALIQIATTGEVGVRRHRRAVATAALLCASMVAAIGALGASVAVLGRSVPALESPTDWVLRVLGNPLFWLAILVISVFAQRRTTTSPARPAADDGFAPDDTIGRTPD